MLTMRPTANQQEFVRVPGLEEAWSRYLGDAMDYNIYGIPKDRYLSAIEEPKLCGKRYAMQLTFAQS
ncbi:MAG: hypothetical protein EOO77_13985 [Oxalobacteraceae bacterium]|jgi:hypothetical protein|nr:MAG: hypothetical protein EOO77_13985 [Oxalobacteraceae bacterium]